MSNRREERDDALREENRRYSIALQELVTALRSNDVSPEDVEAFIEKAEKVLGRG